MSEFQEQPARPRWSISLGNFTLTVAQIAFLAYMGGIFTERLQQVSSVLTNHMQQQQQENIPQRLAILEAQVASERADRIDFRNEVRANFATISQQIEGLQRSAAERSRK